METTIMGLYRDYKVYTTITGLYRDYKVYTYAYVYIYIFEESWIRLRV